MQDEDLRLLAGDVAATWGRVTHCLGRDFVVRLGTRLQSLELFPSRLVQLFAL